ncbi:MAG: 16S rRNA (guanine(966)-N(2))-methyltransferase RsmD [Bdellovibrionota bacterium]
MLRITGGDLRGHSLRVPGGDGLWVRPTQAKLRQAIFNSIQSRIAEARVLDLFAGSGVLGFEALSRGAKHAIFVEKNRATLRLIEENASNLGVIESITLIGEPVESAIKPMISFGPYDIVLADPPYDMGWESRLLDQIPWDVILVEDGIFCLEWGHFKKGRSSFLPEQTRFLVKIRERLYGDSVLTTYARTGHEHKKS